MRSFTLIEVLIIIGILIILIAITFPAFLFFRKDSDLNNSAQQVINTLRFAQNKTLASEGDSQWGVYFDISGDPHQYVLFKGENYLARDVFFDEIHDLPSSIEIFEINLEGESEVIFHRLNGNTSQFGNISLRLKSDNSKFKEIHVQASGKISLEQEPASEDIYRIKDSRHVHFDYGRLIDTATTGEKIILNFEGGVAEEIIIGDNLKSGQIYWEGEVDVFGQVQKMRIYTHRLNNPDTQFSINRDRRFNNVSLEMTISGDFSGTLVEYSADGLTTNSTSIFVSNLQWQ